MVAPVNEAYATAFAHNQADVAQRERKYVFLVSQKDFSAFLLRNDAALQEHFVLSWRRLQGTIEIPAKRAYLCNYGFTPFPLQSLAHVVMQRFCHMQPPVHGQVLSFVQPGHILPSRSEEGIGLRLVAIANHNAPLPY